jgi:purine-binding chemotaxis protein CheW
MSDEDRERDPGADEAAGARSGSDEATDSSQPDRAGPAPAGRPARPEGSAEPLDELVDGFVSGGVARRTRQGGDMTKKEPKKTGTEAARTPVLGRSGLADEVLGQLAARNGEAASAQPTPTGPDRIYEFADSLRREGDERRDKAKEELETWVTFTLAGESYGLPVSHVQEILRVTGITRVPHAPNPVRGVTNMRGRVLPVVDLRLRLGMPQREVDGASRILVVESRDRPIGLLVDAVQQVVRLARSAVQPPPPDVMTTQSDYILGVYHLQESLVILLEVDRVLVIHDSLQAARD